MLPLSSMQHCRTATGPVESASHQSQLTQRVTRLPFRLPRSHLSASPSKDLAPACPSSQSDATHWRYPLRGTPLPLMSGTRVSGFPPCRACGPDDGWPACSSPGYTPRTGTGAAPCGATGGNPIARRPRRIRARLRLQKRGRSTASVCRMADDIAAAGRLGSEPHLMRKHTRRCWTVSIALRGSLDTARRQASSE